MATSARYRELLINWRCLVAYGQSPSASLQICLNEGLSLRALFEHVDSLERSLDFAPQQSRQPSPSPSVTIELLSEVTDPQLVILQGRFGRLSKPQRRAVIGRHVAKVPVDLLVSELAVSSEHLATGTAALLTDAAGTGVQSEFEGDADGAIENMLSPIYNLAAPRDPFRQKRLAILAISAVVAACTLLIVLNTPRLVQPTTKSLTSPPSSTPEQTTITTPIADEPALPPATFVEPDREMEIRITERDTVVRVEPWTGRVIWESREFLDPKLVSVDPNTVTIDSNGNRLLVSLTDGTLLPP